MARHNPLINGFPCVVPCQTRLQVGSVMPEPGRPVGQVWSWINTPLICMFGNDHRRIFLLLGSAPIRRLVREEMSKRAPTHTLWVGPLRVRVSLLFCIEFFVLYSFFQKSIEFLKMFTNSVIFIFLF